MAAPVPPPATLAGLVREALRGSARDGVRVVVACTAVAGAVNAWFHPEPIPFVAPRPYEVLVPCPEPGGPAAPLPAEDSRLAAPSTFLVDARPDTDFARWHWPGARHLTYDYLDPTPPEALAELARDIARSGARWVAVYGDGDDPDTGELLAREISSHGIRNVHFVVGGAPALRGREQVQEPTGGRP